MPGRFDHLNLSAAQPVHAVHRRRRSPPRRGRRDLTEQRAAFAHLGAFRALAAVRIERRAGGHALHARQGGASPPGELVRRSGRARSSCAGRTSSAGDDCMEAERPRSSAREADGPMRPSVAVEVEPRAYFQLMLAHERRHAWQAQAPVRQDPAFPEIVRATSASATSPAPAAEFLEPVQHNKHLIHAACLSLAGSHQSTTVIHRPSWAMSKFSAPGMDCVRHVTRRCERVPGGKRRAGGRC